jgi:hypothetical protein
LQTKITSFQLRDILGGVPMMDPNELWCQIDASRLDETTLSFFTYFQLEVYNVIMSIKSSKRHSWASLEQAQAGVFVEY